MPGTGSLSLITLDNYYAFQMGIGISGATSIQANSISPVFAFDFLTLSFIAGGYTSPSTTIPAFQFLIYIQHPSSVTQYYLNNDKQWQLSATYYDVFVNTTSLYERMSIEMAALPMTGNLVILVRVASGITRGTAEVGNFALTASNPNESRTARGYYDFLSQYKRTQEMQLGYMSDGNMTLSGAMLQLNPSTPTMPNVWGSWYRYGITEAYTNLPLHSSSVKLIRILPVIYGNP